MKPNLVMRGKNLALTLCAAGCMALTSCFPAPDDEVQTIEQSEKQLSGIDVRAVMQMTQTGFDFLQTRTSLTDAGLKNLAYVLLGANDAIVLSGVQTTNIDALSINCAPGTYTLMLFSNSGTAPTINDNGTLTTERAGDTFSDFKSITVARGERTSETLILTRAATRLMVNSTDVIPAEVAKIKYRLQGVSTTYDIKEHVGVNSTTIEALAAVSAFRKNDGTFSFYVTTLIPAVSITNAQLTITTYDATEAEISQHTYTDIPLLQNTRTVMSGAMFHAYGQDLSMTVNTDWGADIEHLF